MHAEILTDQQRKFESLIHIFSTDFGLVGGTAIALHLGHRRSIDFDLFTIKPFDNGVIRRKLVRLRHLPQVLRDEKGQYTIIINGVHFTFFQYPYKIAYDSKWSKIIKCPDLLTLAAMKAHALGRRAKWKDYVDLYFILKDHYSLKDIVGKAKKIFGPEFNEKIFRTQLAYFDDVNYSEEVIYLPGYEVSEQKIKKALIEYSLE